MALIKKIDVDKYFAERRAIRMGRIGLLSRSVTAETESAAKGKRVPVSAEAPTLEHSSLGISSAPIPLISDSRRNRLLRPPVSQQE